MILRRAYLKQVEPLIDKKLIKVITGVRRSGKTVLLEQIAELIRGRGVDEKRIVYISLESMDNDDYRNAKFLYKHLSELCRNAGGRMYILIDEIQDVVGWERVVASLLVDYDCDIYITGSNSKLLSGELATHIAGRYISIRVYPFTLSEAKELTIQNGTFVGDDALFRDYLRFGGLPMRFSLRRESVATYISDTYDAIVIKDIIARNKIKDVNLLVKILRFLMDNVANSFSARSIVAALATDGIKTTADTVRAYVDYIKTAMIISPAERFDIKGKRLLQTNEKYYAMDVGLKNSVKSFAEIDFSKLYENLVYLELLFRGYTVRVGKEDNREVDFVAYKGDELAYVQVCYLISTKETAEREFGNLERINDNYPKYVISGDLPDFSRNGVKHYNIVDFLLGKEM